MIGEVRRNQTSGIKQVINHKNFKDDFPMSISRKIMVKPSHAPSVKMVQICKSKPNNKRENRFFNQTVNRNYLPSYV